MFKKYLRILLSTIMLMGNTSVYLAPFSSTLFRWGAAACIGAFAIPQRAFSKSVRGGLPPANKVVDLGSAVIGDNPTDRELSRLRYFEVPLIPGSQAVQGNENHELAVVLRQTMGRFDDEKMSKVEEFLNNHPDSRWTLALELNRGFWLYHHGYFSLAMNSYKSAWAIGKDEPGYAQTLANRALAEWIRMDSRVGRMDEMQKLLAVAKTRRTSGITSRYLEQAKDALWVMKNRPGKAFYCGAYALKNILKQDNPQQADNPIFDAIKSTSTGFSLKEVKDFSDRLSMNFQVAKRQPGAKVIIPAVVHWKLGHYAALLDEKNGSIYSKDPTFQNETWLSEKALDEESTGYFLVPAGPLPDGWVSISDEEAAKVYGKGDVAGAATPPPFDYTPDSCGMPRAKIDLFSISSMMTDTPLRYNPPVGPKIDMRLVYYQRSPNALPSTNFGPNWNFNWAGYVQCHYHTEIVNNVSVGVLDPGCNLFNPGGGEEEVAAFGGYSNYTQSLITITSTIPSGTYQGFPASVQRQLKDGSVEIYGLALISAQGYTLLLTQVQDAQGNAVNLAYDSADRISTITDAVGQVTTFSYVNPADSGLYSSPYSQTKHINLGGILQANLSVSSDGQDQLVYADGYNQPDYTQKGRVVQADNGGSPGAAIPPTPPPADVIIFDGLVSQITDPFGRTATFNYNNIGNLISVTDMIGMTSSFSYTPPNTWNPYSEDWVTTMTTPYGTTTFDYTGSEIEGTSFTKKTDPMGLQEVATFTQPQPIPNSVSSSAPPASGVNDGAVGDRDTLYWDSSAMAKDPIDPASATIYHWLHTQEDQQSAIIEFTKRPLETQVWNVYSGQTASVYEGSDFMFALPSATTRWVYDAQGNQQEQAYLYSYNDFGLKTKVTDPLQRIYNYTYASNNLDLLNVQDGASETLAGYTYNSQHEALTYTDASGQVWNYSYNAQGQMTSMTAPVAGENTQYNYDSNGHLISIVPPQSGGKVTYTYDHIGRVASKTDSDNGTLSYRYDNLDRITQINYPDGTTEVYGYTKLDLTSYTDRQGRITNYSYDNDRRLISVTDPKQQTTQYGWCACGSLDSITDPKGNKTTFDRDVEGRVTTKTYPDGSTNNYTYDQGSGRVADIVDGKKQDTRYLFGADDKLLSVGYYDGAVNTAPVSFQYDSTLGRLTRMTDGTGTTSYNYYPIGSLGGNHIQSVSQPVGTTSANVMYSYDADGRVTNRSIDGTAETYSFSNTELTNVTNSLGSFAYSYDPASTRLTQITYPNSQQSSFTYYQPSNPIGSGRLQSINNSFGSQTLSKFGYTYKAAGDVNTWQEQLGNLPADAKIYTMGYDLDSQITSATLTSGISGFDGLTANQSVTFGYDVSGNRTVEQAPAFSNNFNTNSLNQLTNVTSKPITINGQTSRPATVTVNGQTVTEDANNQYKTTLSPTSASSTPVTVVQIAADGTNNTVKNHILNTIPLSYDANGNVIQDEKNKYVWDNQNRLVQIQVINPRPTTMADTINMTYDGLGRRASIAELHGTTTLTAKTFVWCDKDLCQERDVTGRTVTKQFFWNGEQINGINYYYAKDNHGSVREMTDGNGVVHASYDYDIFGRQTKISGDLDSDFGYTGFYVEKTICLDLTWFRVYDPEKARWLSRDPKGEFTGPNLYAYVSNNSIRFRDVLGLDKTTGNGGGNGTEGSSCPLPQLQTPQQLPKVPEPPTATSTPPTNIPPTPTPYITPTPTWGPGQEPPPWSEPLRTFPYVGEPSGPDGEDPEPPDTDRPPLPPANPPAFP